MVPENELEGFKSDRYFARSWALLTRDKGWIKPVLLLTVALLVPVVGWLGFMGYVAEWARLTAWGINAAPKQKNVHIGACIAAGWRVFLVIAVWGIGMAVIEGICGHIPLVKDLLLSVWSILCIFLQAVVVVAAVRATIYQKFTGGMRLKTIYQMVSHDISGLLRVTGIRILFACITGVVVFVIAFAAVIKALADVVPLLDELDRYSYLLSSSMEFELGIRIVLSVLGSIGPILLVIVLIANFIKVISTMVVYTAVGLWMRQFNVPLWGREEDPLPPFAPEAQAAAQQPPFPGVQPQANPSGPVNPPAPQPPVAPASAPAAQPQPQQPTTPAPEVPTSEPAVQPPVPDVSDAVNITDDEVVSVTSLASAPEAPAEESAHQTPESTSPAVDETNTTDENGIDTESDTPQE